jgi:hypothetical protein
VQALARLGARDLALLLLAALLCQPLAADDGEERPFDRVQVRGAVPADRTSHGGWGSRPGTPRRERRLSVCRGRFMREFVFV